MRTARESIQEVVKIGLAPMLKRHGFKKNVLSFGRRRGSATGWVGTVPWSFPAMFKYVTGDLAEARRLVQLEADTFADRGCTFQSVAESLHLTFPS